ncbi:MAG: hypothetical protein ABI378_07500 [Chitinophagaceae bacterium]
MKNLLPFAIIAFLAIVSCKKDGNNTANTPANSSYKDSAVTAWFQRTSGVTAADGALSVALSNGKSLFLFGDSYIDNYDPVTKTVPCLFQVRSAGLLVDPANPINGAVTLTGSGSPKSYFALGTDNSYWFWPGTGYQQGDTAYVFMSRLHLTGTGGSFGFEGVDSQYVAKIKVPEMIVAGFASLGSRMKITFGHGEVHEGGFYYAYGTRDNGFGNDVFVARYPENNIYAAWEYFNGSGWNTDINTAAKIYSEFTSSFHVFKLAGKYVLLTTQFSVGCDQGKEIYSYTSNSLTGPFSNKKMIWTVNDTLQGHYPFFYLAYAHPEIDNGKQELLVTYCINGYGSCVNTCINNRLDPNMYRPRAIRVPYSVMGL